MKWYLCWRTQESNRENQIFQQEKKNIRYLYKYLKRLKYLFVLTFVC